MDEVHVKTVYIGGKAPCKKQIKYKMLNIQMKQKKQLSKVQQQILLLFIREFLPIRGNKRKHEGNEIEYIANTLNRIFLKNFGYSLCKEDVLDTFSELGYSLFTKKANWDDDTKNYRPALRYDLIRMDDVYSRYECAYIYVDVEATIVRNLRKSTMTLSPNTNKNLCDTIDSLKKRIKQFVAIHKDNM